MEPPDSAILYFGYTPWFKPLRTPWRKLGSDHHSTVPLRSAVLRHRPSRHMPRTSAKQEAPQKPKTVLKIEIVFLIYNVGLLYIAITLDDNTII